MKSKILVLGMAACLFFACDKSKVENEIEKKNKKETFRFKKLKRALSSSTTIATAEILKQIPDAKKKGYELKSIVVSDKKIAEVSGQAPNFKITLKKAGIFKITIVLQKKGFPDTELTGEIELVFQNQFQKFVRAFSKEATITAADILGQVQEITGLGYALETLEIPAEKSNIAAVQGTKPNFTIQIKKPGIFTANMVLVKTGFPNVSLTDCEFEITKGIAPSLRFPKYHHNIREGAITSVLVLSGVKGDLIGMGYTLKSIDIPADKNNIAEVEGTKPNFSIKVKNKGRFMAMIVLESLYYEDITMNDCEFVLVKPYFLKRTKKGMVNSVLQMQDGNFVAAGESSVGYDYFGAVFKFHKTTGRILWEKNFPEGSFNSICGTRDGHLVVAGFKRNSISQGANQIWVLKLNKNNGNIIWQKEYGGVDQDYANAVIEIADGNLVVVGKTWANGGWIAKLNKNNGEMIKEFKTGNRNITFYSVVQMADGHLVVGGEKWMDDRRKNDSYILKLNKNNGNIIWQKTFENEGYDDIMSLTKTADGHLAAAGVKNGNTWVAKLDKADGTQIWEKTYGANIAYAILKTTDGNLAVAGRKDNALWIAKLREANGNILWQKTYEEGKNAFDIKETRAGNLLVGGTHYIKTDYQLVFKAKQTDGQVVSE